MVYTFARIVSTSARIVSTSARMVYTFARIVSTLQSQNVEAQALSFFRIGFPPPSPPPSKSNLRLIAAQAKLVLIQEELLLYSDSFKFTPQVPTIYTYIGSLTCNRFFLPLLHIFFLSYCTTDHAPNFCLCSDIFC